MRANRSFCLSLTFLVFCVQPLWAKPAASVKPVTPTSSLATALGGTDATVEVEVNKGKAVHLSAPAASVAIANPLIADVQVVSPTMLFVNGTGVGETSIIAVDAAEHVILQRAR